MKTKSTIEVGTAARIRQQRYNPLRSASPESLSRQLDEWSAGWYRECCATWDEIERRDYTLASVVPKRKKAASRRGWEILQVEELDAAQQVQADRHASALKYFYDNLTVTSALDRNRRGGVRHLLQDMMGCVGHGYAVHELVWQPKFVAGEWQLAATATFVPLWCFENRTGLLRYTGGMGSYEGRDLEPGGWLVTVGDAPLHIASSLAWLLKSMSLRDWVTVSEFAGMPPVTGHTEAAKDSPEYDALKEALDLFGAEFRAVLTGSSKIVVGDAKGAVSADMYDKLVEKMDRALSALWRGADLSTMSSGSGEGFGASLQGDETDILEDDDCVLLEETLQRTLDKQVIQYLFGEEPLAYFAIRRASRPDDQGDLAKIEKAVSLGVPVGRRFFQERFAIPEIAEGDQPLRLPAPAAASPSQIYSVPSLPGLRAMPNERNAFQTAATAEVGRAAAADLQPVLDELAAIADGRQEPTRERLLALRAKLPEVARRLGKSSKLAAALERITGPAVAEGYVRGALARPQKKGTS
jgi:phage gp29-like protein